MADPVDLIIPLLREMRRESAANFGGIGGRLDKVEARLDKMDETLVTFRHALSADSRLSKIVTGEFEERLSMLERRLSDLETHK
ncbi:MAG: hypothetical protein ABWY18_00640 [Tardiphaga sp.]